MPSPIVMNRAIELHDTTVAGIATIGAQILLFLRAYVHQTEGIPGVDAGTGWIQAAIIRIGEATFGEADGMPQLPAEIWTGNLTLEDRATLDNMLPLPFQVSGAVTLRLSLDAPANVVIHGRGAEIVTVGEPLYIE